MPSSKYNKNYDYSIHTWIMTLVNTGPGEGTSKLFGHAVILVEGLLPDGSYFIGEYDITGNSYPEEQSYLQGSLGNTMGYITKIRCNPESINRFQPGYKLNLLPQEPENSPMAIGELYLYPKDDLLEYALINHSSKKIEKFQITGKERKIKEYFLSIFNSLKDGKKELDQSLRRAIFDVTSTQGHIPDIPIPYRDYESKNYSFQSWYVKPENAIQMIKSIETDAEILDTEIKNAQYEQRNVNWPFKYQKAGVNRWSIWGGNGGHNCITWAEDKLAIAGAGNKKKLTDSIKTSTEVHIKCLIQ